MKFSHIREFLTLEQVGEFQAAAQELNIAQGTLSKHIKAMEEELGVRLFNRIKKQQISISDFGTLFLPYAKQLIELQDEYTSNLTTVPVYTKKFVIGLSPSVLQYEIMDLLIRFKTEHKNIPIVFTERDSGVLLDLVRTGECDLAFVRENSEEEDHDFYKLQFACDTLIAALPKDHPLAAYPVIALSQLKREEFLLLPEYSPVHQLCVSECKKAGFEPNIIYTGTSGSALISLVGQGLGISLTMKTPKRFRRMQQVVYVDVTPKVTSYINLIYRRDNFSPTINTFLRFIKPYLGYD